MSYRTIKDKVRLEHKRAHVAKCQCGKNLNRRTIHRYKNGFGEYMPICKACAKFAEELGFEIIYPSIPQTFKLKGGDNPA